ncbi:hypothetical protein LQL77_32205 [Rhodococcus cerastii]|nr:hypothetical protein [Rhodococcus cerastii]
MTSRPSLILVTSISAFAISTLAATGLASATSLVKSTATPTQTGNGSNDSPYTAPCSTDASKDSCVVDSFAPRTLKMMSDEFVPAYQCPADHPWLANYDYAPLGTTLIHGVEIHGLNPIGASITGATRDETTKKYTYDGYEVALVGTRTGFPNSSAQNWSFDKHSYRVVLHCTNNLEDARHHYVTDSHT